MSKALITESLLTDIADAIRAKTGGTASMTPAEMVPAIGSISGGGTPEAEEKDVNFIDYDGKILYSYTAAEASELRELPENPEHTGLTAQGWNYTLAEMKAAVAAHGACVVGQTYITDDGKTRIYCEFQEGRVSPYLGLYVKGTVVVAWGDGTATNTLTGNGYRSVRHTYAAAGKYMITLEVTSGYFEFTGNYKDPSYVGGQPTCQSKLLTYNDDYSDSRSYAYRQSIRKIEMGTGARLGGSTYAGLGYLMNLESITLTAEAVQIYSGTFQFCVALAALVIPKPSSQNFAIGQYALDSAYGIKKVSVPPGCTAINAGAFLYCRNLAMIQIPDSVSSIGQSAFQGCYNLRTNLPEGITAIPVSLFSVDTYMSKITIPSGVTSIAASAFWSMHALAEIHFKPETPPTVANSNAFGSLPTDCTIYVPAGTLAAYKAATNYPSPSTYTYIEEE